ncbi:glycoside hydrolase family 5 protein [Streptomyces olivaceoviridis]|uniref:glycoside hydrolase family 5 protein n=1 Tax=Streptomyces olivaceoviridis TaxID=1921 RepID=UPI0036FD2C68
MAAHLQSPPRTHRAQAPTTRQPRPQPVRALHLVPQQARGSPHTALYTKATTRNPGNFRCKPWNRSCPPPSLLLEATIMRCGRSARACRTLLVRALGFATALTLLTLGLAAQSVATPYADVAVRPAAQTALTGTQLAASWTGPLSTRGRYIVDADGNRFKLKSSNWAGAQGTYEGSGDVNDLNNHQAHQKSDNIPLGLDRTPISQIMADFHSLGINSIRLPFANALIHDTTVVPDAAVAANPQLKGKTPLEVFDAVVMALTADGFAVILNNHTTNYRFCCALDGNERWNSGQSTQQWVDDWVFLVNRYKSNKRVVGADLRNEVRRDTWNDPNWGWGNDHDLNKAYEIAGNRILQAHPDILIVMEGINWQGIPQGMFSHGRPNLKPVATLSNTLIYSNKLVYSAHFYGYTGSHHTGASGGWQNGETNDPRYQDLSLEDLVQAVNDEALFVTQEGQHFTAPVWISEFGVGGRGYDDDKAKAWFKNFTDILVKNDTDFAQWPVVGWTDSNGKPQDNWALINYSADGRQLSVNDPGDWRATDWNKLVNAPSKTGQIPQPNHWNMLNVEYGDYDASKKIYDTQARWSEGSTKEGSCPDGQRLLGIGRSYSHALCTDFAEPKATGGDYVVAKGDVGITGDWGEGYNRLQCPNDTFAVGFSINNMSGNWNRPNMHQLLCAPSTTPLPHDVSASRLVWFDNGDNRPATGGSAESDWGNNDYKGQCKDTEYLAGVAYTWKWNHGGQADALLCRRLPSPAPLHGTVIRSM